MNAIRSGQLAVVLFAVIFIGVGSMSIVMDSMDQAPTLTAEEISGSIDGSTGSDTFSALLATSSQDTHNLDISTHYYYYSQTGLFLNISFLPPKPRGPPSS